MTNGDIDDVHDDLMDETQDYASPFKGLLWAILAVLIGTGLYEGLSPLAHVIPFRWEQAVALAVQPAPANECHGSATASAALQKLVLRLYPLEPGDEKFAISLRVVKDPELNAFAGLGGQITVNSGLLKQAKSPEELAGVLAHEIGHVQHRHILQGAMHRLVLKEGLNIIFSGTPAAADWSGFFLNMSFTRSEERQADEEALKRLQLAHIDNAGFRQFFERLENSGTGDGFLFDHPSNDSRIKMAQTFSNNQTEPIMKENEWLALKSYCDKPNLHPSE